MGQSFKQLIETIGTQPLPEKVDYALRHLLAMELNPNERLSRLNTALELLESHKADIERGRVCPQK